MSFSSYYVAQNGQQLGPYSIPEIENKLTTEKLNWHDYIYDDKSQDWVMLMEFSPLTNLFNKSFQNPIKSKPVAGQVESDPLKRRIWYVLKQNNNYGPFSKQELIQMLQGKTLTEYDFIWHNGMGSWKRLAEVSEFSVEELKSIFNANPQAKDESGKNVFFRRKHPRAKYNSQAIVHDQKKVYKSVGVEISAGGAGLIIEGASFEIGQQFYLHFKPGQNVPAFNAICKVMSKRGNIFGIQFIKISGVAKQFIAEFTENISNKKAG